MVNKVFTFPLFSLFIFFAFSTTSYIENTISVICCSRQHCCSFVFFFHNILCRFPIQTYLYVNTHIYKHQTHMQYLTMYKMRKRLYVFHMSKCLYVGFLLVFFYDDFISKLTFCETINEWVEYQSENKNCQQLLLKIKTRICFQGIHIC